MRFCVIACHVLWREISRIGAESPHVIHPHFLQFGLHHTPNLLRAELQRLIDEHDTEEFDAILLGYGLCGNGTLGLSSSSTRLVMMRGHDCITFLLGSRERYMRCFDEHPGTYWYSPGWIDNDAVPGAEQDEKLRREYADVYGPEKAEMLVRAYRKGLENYRDAKLIDQGLFPMERYEEYTKRNAGYTGLRYDTMEGSPKLIEDFLGGNWDWDRFLVVEPGNKIEAAADERIVEQAKG